MDWLLGKGRYPFIAVVAVVTVFMAVHASRIEIEQSNRSMTAQDDAVEEAYLEFRRLFGNDEDLLLTVSHPDLLSRNGVAMIRKLTHQIRGLDGVGGVLSLVTAKRVVAGPAGAETAPLIPEDNPAAFDADELEMILDRNPRLSGLLVSDDRRTAALVVELEQRDADDAYVAEVIVDVRDMVGRIPDEGFEFHLTGVPVQKRDVTIYLERDKALLLPLVVLLMSVMLALFFRRASGVLLPLFVTGLSLVWTLGFYELSGLMLNPITSLLPPVVMVLAVAGSVHVYQGWRVAAGQGFDRRAVITAVIDRIRRPCFFTALTTALGLLSLVISSTPAVRAFGAFAALGVLFAFLATVTVLPVGLSFLRPAGSSRASAFLRDDRAIGKLDRFLEWTVELAAGRPRTVLCVALAVSAASAALIPEVRNNTDLVGFLRADAPLYKDTEFIESKLGAVNAVELMVRRRDGADLDSVADIRALARLEGELDSLQGVAAIHSLLDLLRQIQRAEFGADELVLPSDQDELDYAFDLLETAGDEELLGRLVSPGHDVVRLRVGLGSMGTQRAAALVASVLRVGERLLGDEYLLTPTGSYYRVARGSNSIVAAQVKSFTLALVLVMAAIGLLFRSSRYLAVAFFPNVVPILCVGGLMGALGIDLSTGTAMVPSVVIGIAVDDTIYYLWRFRNEDRGGDAVAALRRTTMGTGRALTVSSLALALGFAAGGMGSFKPTIFFSLLTGSAMLIALLCDLIVLPACLLLTRTGARRHV
ncbi:MAG: RND family transporter [Candidatus Binatia bacterium]